MPHLALNDLHLGDFIIPKGSTVSGSLYHSVRDPRFFKDPELFHPERFLDKGKNCYAVAFLRKVTKLVFGD